MKPNKHKFKLPIKELDRYFEYKRKLKKGD